MFSRSNFTAGTPNRNTIWAINTGSKKLVKAAAIFTRWRLLTHVRGAEKPYHPRQITVAVVVASAVVVRLRKLHRQGLQGTNSPKGGRRMRHFNLRKTHWRRRRRRRHWRSISMLENESLWSSLKVHYTYSGFLWKVACVHVYEGWVCENAMHAVSLFPAENLNKSVRQCPMQKWAFLIHWQQPLHCKRSSPPL